MGFTDSLKKVIGIEEIDEDEVVTDEELSAAKKKLRKGLDRKTDLLPEDDRFSSGGAKMEPPFRYSSPAASPSFSPDLSKKEKKYSVTGTGSLKLLVIEPKNFNECPKLVDSLKARKPVIINLEKLETETARKIFDFLSGATYALNGSVQKIANNIYIFAPENVNITSSDALTTKAEPESKSPWR